MVKKTSEVFTSA